MSNWVETEFELQQKAVKNWAKKKLYYQGPRSNSSNRILRCEM